MNNSNSEEKIAGELLDGLDAATMQQALCLKLTMHYLPLSWRRSAGKLLEALDRGVTLEAAVEEHKSRLPTGFNAMLQAGLQLPDPGRFVLEACRVRWEKHRLTRDLIAILSYPLVLLLSSLLMACAASIILAPVLINLTESFGLANSSSSIISDQRAASLGLLGLFAWCGLTGLAIVGIGPSWAGLSVLTGLPYVGRAFRWISLYEILQRLEAIAQQGLGGVVATKRAAMSFVHSPAEASMGHIADRHEAGLPIGESLARSLLSDGLCGPALLALDYPNQARPNFANAAQILWRLSEMRLNTLSSILPFLIFVFIVNVVVGTLSTYLGLLVNLIRLLSAF
jgi:type II secretory pathway component PulF